MECESAGEVFVDNRIELQIQAQPVHNVDNFPQNIPVFSTCGKLSAITLRKVIHSFHTVYDYGF